jgi:hypothetical protein
MSAQLLVLLLGSVGDGEYFQLVLLGLGILSVVYCTLYVVFRRIRIKKAAQAEAEALSALNLTNLPSH